MTQTTDASDVTLRARQRAMWALGDYPAVASKVISALGPVLVRACAIRTTDRVLDLAAGSGNVAIPAAALGADVMASDLTPELLERGRRDAEAFGIDLRWEVADAEHLPYADAEFDVVVSCVGVMFAPHHKVAADELVRVCRSGGRIGLIAWTPTGFVGELFATMKPFSAPPPLGAQPPPLWGNESHVRELLADRVREIRVERRKLRVARFAGPAEFRDFFREAYGPTVAAYQHNAADPDRVAALDDALLELARRYFHGGAMEWEYLLLTAHRS